MTIALRKKIFEAGIMVKDFATVTGIGAGTLRDICSGHGECSPENQARIIAACDTYGIDPSDIFDSIKWSPSPSGRLAGKRVLRAVLDAAKKDGCLTQNGLVKAVKARGYEKVSASLISHFAAGKEKIKRALKKHIWAVLKAEASNVLSDLGVNDANQLFCYEKKHQDVIPKKEMKIMQLTQQFLELETLEFFGLARDPFDEPDSKQDIYINRELERFGARARKALLSGRFVAITGKTGCGKSIAKWHFILPLAKRADVRLCTVQSFKKEAVNAHHVQTAILKSLDPEARGSADHELLTRKVINMLANEVEQGRKIILVIEEAHALKITALKALKRLYEVHKEDARFGFKRAISILLVGQRELDYTLMSPAVMEVTRRITKLALSHRSAKEKYFRDAPRYIAFRLTRAARNGRQREVFDKSAIKEISRLCGTFLDVNVLAGRSLALAHEIGEKKVSKSIVQKAAQAE